MQQRLVSLIELFRKFFAPLPHLPKKILRPIVPYLSWYVFLRGLAQIITGFRDIAWGLHYRNLPYILATLINVPPFYYILGGVMSIAIGVFYLKTFVPLADVRRRALGWQAWATAAAALTVLKIYDVVFIHRSTLWFFITFAIGWYLIFEFEQVTKVEKTFKNHLRRKKADFPLD